MASVTNISGLFTIHCVMDAAAAHVITGPKRAYKVLRIDALNAGGTPNIRVEGAVDIAAAQATLTNLWKRLVLNGAAGATEVAAGQALTITNANVSTTEVIIYCVATGGGEVLPST